MLIHWKEAEIQERVRRLEPVWVAWPKRASKLKSDLTQATVRKACMDAGMVDYKICAVDETWSALLFTWRGD
ncbi:MAG: hypothetical protein JXA97_10730 [Anaerolineales bacterium]|nr:hypothetical protein [Anaerolineales bacterium]